MFEEVSKNVEVVFVFFVGLGNWSVGFEDGEVDGCYVVGVVLIVGMS